MVDCYSHKVVIHLSQKFTSMLCLFFCLFLMHFFVSFKHDFYTNAEKMIVKTR